MVTLYIPQSHVNPAIDTAINLRGLGGWLDGARPVFPLPYCPDPLMRLIPLKPYYCSYCSWAYPFF